MVPGNGTHHWEELPRLHNKPSRTDNASRRGRTAQRQRKQTLALTTSLLYLGCWLCILCSVSQFLHLCSDNMFCLYFLIGKISVVDWTHLFIPKSPWWGNSKKKWINPQRHKSVEGDTNKQEIHLEDGKWMGGWCLTYVYFLVPLSAEGGNLGQLSRFVSQTLKPSGIEATNKGQRRYESAKNKRIGAKSIWVAVRSPDLFPPHTPRIHTQANPPLLPWHNTGVYSLGRLSQQSSGQWNMGTPGERVSHRSKVTGMKSKYVY